MSSKPANSSATILTVDFAAFARKRAAFTGRPQAYECNSQFSRYEDVRGHITSTTRFPPTNLIGMPKDPLLNVRCEEGPGPR